MKITKKEYADRVTRAYSYWLHACEAKAFRGWKSAVARGLALRKIFLFFFPLSFCCDEKCSPFIFFFFSSCY